MAAISTNTPINGSPTSQALVVSERLSKIVIGPISIKVSTLNNIITIMQMVETVKALAEESYRDKVSRMKCEIALKLLFILRYTQPSHKVARGRSLGGPGPESADIKTVQTVIIDEKSPWYGIFGIYGSGEEARDMEELNHFLEPVHEKYWGGFIIRTDKQAQPIGIHELGDGTDIIKYKKLEDLRECAWIIVAVSEGRKELQAALSETRKALEEGEEPKQRRSEAGEKPVFWINYFFASNLSGLEKGG